MASQGKWLLCYVPPGWTSVQKPHSFTTAELKIDSRYTLVLLICHKARLVLRILKTINLLKYGLLYP